jgi:two-component system, OmpR family, response regulator
VRLLVVEDEPGMGKALRRGLEAEGFAVDVVRDGTAGLGAARFGGYDAVILDIMLPGLSGYAVLRTLREEGNWVPVLMLSAKDGEYDLADALDYGADDYLTKPFSFVVLLARLRVLLRRDPVPRPALLTVGALSLDPAARQVTLDGTPIGLARREFAVLEEIMRAHPAPAAKEHLLDRVWSNSDDIHPNIVEVYVRHLRRKLGAATIETVRGVGYRIAA